MSSAEEIINQALKKLAPSRVFTAQDAQKALNVALSKMYLDMAKPGSERTGILWLNPSSRDVYFMSQDGLKVITERELYMAKPKKKKRLTKFEKQLIAENERLSGCLHSAEVKISCMEYDLRAANADTERAKNNYQHLSERFDKVFSDFEKLSNGVKFAMRILSNAYPSMDSIANLQRNIGRAEESLRCSMMASGAIPMVFETNALDTCAKAEISRSSTLGGLAGY